MELFAYTISPWLKKMRAMRASSFFRLPCRVASALVHPRLAGFLCPHAQARYLHVFVRMRDGVSSGLAGIPPYAEVEVADESSVAALQTAVANKLQLDVLPDTLRLLKEVKGGKGTLLALDSRKSLKQAKVKPGSSILVELLHRAEKILQPKSPPMLLELPPRVMTRGPDPLLDAGLLKTLRCPDNPSLQRVAALSELVKDTRSRLPCTGVSFETLPLRDKETHGALLGVLMNHARELMEGSFRRRYAPCRTVMGAHGMGKTVILRAFSLVAASLFPGLIPLYVSAASVLAPRTSFQVAPLVRFMAFAAQGSGPRDAAIESSPLEVILRSRGQRMLVLLDEVDQLFKMQPGTEVARNVTFSLGTLSDIAEESTGDVGVLLCGSSSSTFQNVCGSVGTSSFSKIEELVGK